jgi:membrane-associated protease RseP (regulator of RpoE activity)
VEQRTRQYQVGPPTGIFTAAASRQGRKEPRDRYWLHALLFLLTLASTVYSGGWLVSRFYLYERAEVWFEILGMPVTPIFLYDGFLYGLSLLLFLSVHEFGHYFAARYHGIRVSLPYYIPFPFNGIGTFGAVISIREPLPSTRKLFDVGAAGPLAGFVVALGLLLYALATLPPPSYLFDIPGHEAINEYIRQHGEFPREMPTPPPEMAGTTLVLGQTPLFWFLSQFFDHVPPMWELYHYPVLFASWLALFFTALNLLPIGQLDGGHILYSLLGRRWHIRFARGFFLLLMLSASVGFIADVMPSLAEMSPILGNLGWFILAFILFFFLNRIFAGELKLVAPTLITLVVAAALISMVEPLVNTIGYSAWFVLLLLILFFVRVDHPPVMIPERLTRRRKVLGILCIVIFFLCFSLRPLSFV